MATKLRLLAGRLKRATDPADWIQLSSGRIKKVTTGASIDLLSGRRKAVVAPVVPDLTSASSSQAGGDLCTQGTNWVITYSWTTTNPNDTDYQIDVDKATDSPPTNWASFSTGNTTSSSNVQEDTGIQGNNNGGEDCGCNFRTGRIKLVRKSDSQVIEQMDTTTQTICFSCDPCV